MRLASQPLIRSARSVKSTLYCKRILLAKKRQNHHNCWCVTTASYLVGVQLFVAVLLLTTEDTARSAFAARFKFALVLNLSSQGMAENFQSGEAMPCPRRQCFA